jgi:hypothetical protein
MSEWVADCHASGTVRTAAWAVNEGRELALCGHCTGRHKGALSTQGWVIVPADTFAPTGGVGTESTGRHFALEEQP